MLVIAEPRQTKRKIKLRIFVLGRLETSFPVIAQFAEDAIRAGQVAGGERCRAQVIRDFDLPGL